MQRHLCIHGHFYQPPREDPWLGDVLPEGSAAPVCNWNARIARESYAPLAFARIMGVDGRIARIINAYEWISFNAGPTLLEWMQRHEPEAYARMLDGDRLSRQRLGFGNAMAQIRHHIIMPLASDLDKRVETAWAVADFEARFGRAPEGMWLSETAVDTATLEILAEAGLAFTILAPRQAEAVAEPDSDDWRPVDEGSLDISRPYRVELPSGRAMAVFFYHGALSQAVAFERLLEDGDRFWKRLSGAAGEGLLSLATDGETYGHHFTFGEMALAFVLDTAASGADNIALTNYAHYLASNPPSVRVRIRENSSWSCEHGVERWRSDCGCNTGDHPDWNQAWRAPLRQALDACKAGLDAHFTAVGKKLFKDPEAALLDYGRILSGAVDHTTFATQHLASGLNSGQTATAWQLLSMERFGQASLASCAWFFDDLDRLEPANAMANALRAMDLARETGGPDLEPAFLDTMALARTNRSDKGEGRTGREMFEQDVRPRRETPASLAALALWTARARGLDAIQDNRTEISWPNVSVELTMDDPEAATLSGTAVVRFASDPDASSLAWRCEAGDTPLACLTQAAPLPQNGKLSKSAFKDVPAQSPANLPWNKRQSLALERVNRFEQDMWRDMESAALAGLDMFQPFAEAQTTQNMAWQWGRLWVPLTWLFLSGKAEGHPARDDLALFLHETIPGPAQRMAQALRVVAAVTEAVTADPPRLDEAAALVGRCREIQFHPDWWAVQNACWLLDHATPGWKELADLLWFEA